MRDLVVTGYMNGQLVARPVDGRSEGRRVARELEGRGVTHVRVLNMGPRPRRNTTRILNRLRLLVAAVTLVMAVTTGLVGWYGQPGTTLNGGVTVGDCGFELWGQPGPFCVGDR
jgi:hypothetical protein